MFLFRRLRAACFILLSLFATTALAASREEVAVIRTAKGEMAFRFFDHDAPQHSAYVKELIRRGFYDQTTFHRVIPHFVIQGGIPTPRTTTEPTTETARRIGDYRRSSAPDSTTGRGRWEWLGMPILIPAPASSSSLSRTSLDWTAGTPSSGS